MGEGGEGVFDAVPGRGAGHGLRVGSGGSRRLVRDADKRRWETGTHQPFLSSIFSFSDNRASTTRRMTSAGALSPVHASNCAAAWRTNISTPRIVLAPDASACCSSLVFIGL